jgi:phosphoglycolate phosphatase-like HAD superfamily hydrolase
MIHDLDRLLSRTSAVLFDFDGPVCSVFSGLPAPVVARDLRKHLSERGWPVYLPNDLVDDPLEVLRAAAAIDKELGREVDDLLTAAETRAVEIAEPTAGGEASIRACRRSGRVVGIVSNNSTAAVRAYLTRRHLADLVDGPVVGRAYAQPHFMKPDPFAIRLALDALRMPGEAVVLIGDSTTDVLAARAASVGSVGYANRREKHVRLAGADSVLDDMQAFAEALARVPPPAAS